ncbi:MAG: hypothetical protein RIT81_40880, partial [Deltaproteobacteria bacterium]
AEAAWRGVDGLFLIANAQYSSDVFAENTNETEVDDYVVAGLRGGKAWRLNRGELTLHAGVNNLFDEDYFSNLRINANSDRPDPADRGRRRQRRRRRRWRWRGARADQRGRLPGRRGRAGVAGSDGLLATPTKSASPEPEPEPMPSPSKHGLDSARHNPSLGKELEVAQARRSAPRSLAQKRGQGLGLGQGAGADCVSVPAGAAKYKTPPLAASPPRAAPS